MTTNRTPGPRSAARPGCGQGDQPQHSDTASVGQFAEPGTLPLDPRPDVGDVACIICGSRRAEFVTYYTPPEIPEVTTKYGFCTRCANTPVLFEGAERINDAITQELAASAAWFRFLRNAIRWAS